ncbi:hypothetical protein HYT17_01980 [Candidatus Microgenomates bacterium]|nr:hypothetical protein [Candidatus Microgenomates bacterium]
MGRISRRKIDPEVEERIFEIFWDYLAHLGKQEEINEFLISLLSYTEQVMLAKRLAIAVLLSRGVTYEYISETIKVSPSTVGTVHKQILIGAPGYLKAIKHIKSQEQQEKLWNKLEEVLLKLSPPKRYGSPAWEKKSTAGKVLAKRKRKLSAL